MAVYATQIKGLKDRDKTYFGAKSNPDRANMALFFYTLLLAKQNANKIEKVEVLIFFFYFNMEKKTINEYVLRTL